MKLKAVIQRGCPSQFRNAIEAMRNEVMSRVIGPHLHRPDFGPAEFYIQECDEAVSEEPLCEVRLSGVSLAYDRSEKDFDDARTALEMVYKRKIEEFFPTGINVQLMVSLMLDGPRKNGSSLVEGPTEWVSGHGRK